ncbi:MAG TPA: NADH-quinone oxidoreductase subunit L, partial [Roseiflexaceae bacterium]|nr:NADH-quinone oxidoreductase subunit L [Roseiflexaceae bacterium]
MGLFLQYAWLIPVFPLLAFAIITLTPIRNSRSASGWLAIGLMVAATVVALGVGGEVLQGVHVKQDGSAEVLAAGEAHAAEGAAPEGEGEAFAFPEANIVSTFRWAPAGGDAAFTMGYYIDPAAAAMLLMVTITSTCIHLFSMGYMAHDERQSRFFSFISLFTAAMLLMVIASNLLLFFMAWELMGLCSYLLIGFWYDKVYADPRQITPRQAAIKAFITTRVGDVLFMVGLAYLWTQAGSLDFGTAERQIFNPEFLARVGGETNALGMSVATGIALLLFAGTVGKSAQFPLHVWLPDAMEGPTPVSALIHAATMVAAGVFLVGRTYPIFVASGTALDVVAFIGAFTALFAALIAVGQFDIKRILAYSTLSQLGFMVAALGIGGWVAGIFHLLTHAFFKALLFLGSGSVIHGMEATVGHDSNTAQDIRNMGNLRRFMPTTWLTYMAGYLALAGIVPFAGFWSKDEILADAFGHGRYIVWIVLTLASFLTAFYMTRQIMVVFYGNFRGHNPRIATHPSEPQAVDHAHGHDDEHAGEHAHGGHDPHESPWTMTVPLIILAVFAVIAGFANLPGFHWLSTFFGQAAGEFDIVVAGIATVLALAGIGMGYSLYRNAFATAEELDPLEQRMPGIFRLLNRKFYFDEIYGSTFGKLSYGLAWAWNLFDRYVLDGVLRLTAAITVFFGRLNFI